MRPIQTSAFVPNTDLTSNTNTKPERKSNMFKQMISFAVVAGLVLALSPAAPAAIIDPTDPLVGSLGLSEGDTFHLVFVTGVEMKSKYEHDIEVYNTFVNDLANNLNGNTGSVVAQYDWTWKVIGSTSSIDAIDNTGTTYDLANPGNPIFRLNDYAKVADDYADLWDGSIDSSISYTEKAGPMPGSYIFTGTHTNGTKFSRYLLGDNEPRIGRPGQTGTSWISWTEHNGADPNSLFALSEAVTVTATEVIPEPSTFLLWAFGSIGILVMRRRGFRR